MQRSRAIPPVRFVHPRIEGKSSLIFASALGGGMLEGDTYSFTLNCGENASMAFIPQANTRVFPCPQGGVTRQEVYGTVCANGLAVIGGDPTVLYGDSRFSQTQRWVLHPGARLIIMDWLVAGRLERGERFAFRSFQNEIRVEDATGRPLLMDRLRLQPEKENMDAAWGSHASHLAIYVLGPGWKELHDPMERWLSASQEGKRPNWMSGALLAGLGIRADTGFSLRALGRDRAALEPLVERIFELLSPAEWLGCNPWARKY